jgi:hypothetical protein
MPDLALANAGVLKQLLLQTALNPTGRVAIHSPYNRTTLATVITGQRARRRRVGCGT